MGFCTIEIVSKDGSRTVEHIGQDPLRDDAPKGQVEREIEKFENWPVDDRVAPKS